MSTRPSTTPVRLRTYAADLERARENQATEKVDESTASATTTTADGAPAAIPKPAPTIKESAKAKTPHSFNKPARTQTPPPPLPATSTPAAPSRPTEKAAAPAPVPKPVPAPTPKRVPPKATKIPAFHELQKKVGNKNKSALGRGDFDSTIIRETKKHSFNPFASIATSITKWLKGLTKRKKKGAVYSVPDAQTRKGVVEAATSKTGTSFTAPNDSLKERIRRRNAERAAEADDHETYWSPNTDTLYPLLDAPEEMPVATPIQNITLERKKLSGYENQNQVAAPAAITTPATPAPVQTPPAAPVAEPQPVIQTPEPAAPAPEPVAEPTAPVAAPATDTTTTAPALRPTQSGGTNRTGLLQNADTNTLTLQVMGVIVALFAVVVTGIMVFNSVRIPATVESGPTVSEAIISVATLQPVQITTDTLDETAARIIDAAQTAPTGLVELPLLGPDGSEVSPAYVFSVLDFNSTPMLSQSIITLHFVSVNSSRPSLLFTLSDREAVQGGLLDWEQSMAADLAALYELPSTQNLRFGDQQINGIDTRILAQDGKTLLIYAFLDDQTVLIAPSRNDFAQIANLYQQ